MSASSLRNQPVPGPSSSATSETVTASTAGEQLSGSQGPFIDFGEIVQTREALTMDKAKLEKKREKNRIAANKCRQKKVQKIGTLGE